MGIAMLGTAKSAESDTVATNMIFRMSHLLELDGLTGKKRQCSAFLGTTATPVDQAIGRHIKQRPNDPAAGSIRERHGSAVHEQLFEFKRRTCNEPIPPIGRDLFLTMNDLAPSTGALDYRVPAVHSNHLIDAGSAVGV